MYDKKKQDVRWIFHKTPDKINTVLLKQLFFNLTSFCDVGLLCYQCLYSKNDLRPSSPSHRQFQHAKLQMKYSISRTKLSPNLFL